jgi:hypothetical protein
VARKTGFRMGIESTAAPNVAGDFTLARSSETVEKSKGSACRRIRQRATRSKPSKTGKGRSEQAESDLGRFRTRKKKGKKKEGQAFPPNPLKVLAF